MDVLFLFFPFFSVKPLRCTPSCDFGEVVLRPEVGGLCRGFFSPPPHS